MSEQVSVEYVGQLEVLHANQAPQYKFFHDKKSGKYVGELRWRDFEVKLQHGCGTIGEAKNLLAKRMYQHYTKMAQDPPLPLRVDAIAPARQQPTVAPDADWDRVSRAFQHAATIIEIKRGGKRIGSTVLNTKKGFLGLHGAYAAELSNAFGCTLLMRAFYKDAPTVPAGTKFAIYCRPTAEQSTEHIYCNVYKSAAKDAEAVGNLVLSNIYASSLKPLGPSALVVIWLDQASVLNKTNQPRAKSDDDDEAQDDGKTKASKPVAAKQARLKVVPAEPPKTPPAEVSPPNETTDPADIPAV